MSRVLNSGSALRPSARAPEEPQAKPRALGNCSATKSCGIPHCTSASRRHARRTLGLQARLVGILLGIACQSWQAEPPPPPPFETVATIAASLRAASEHAAEAPEKADAAWTEAHHQFETIVEPALRARHPADVVAAVEYRFSWFRQVWSQPEAASAEVTKLEQKLLELLSVPQIGPSDAPAAP